MITISKTNPTNQFEVPVRRRFRFAALIYFVSVIGTLLSHQHVCFGQIQLQAPPQAVEAGYTHTSFSAGVGATMFSPDTVDVNGTLNPKFQWYPGWFYFNRFTPPLNVVFPADAGRVGAVLLPSKVGISTMAAPHAETDSPSTESGIVGEAFGGGGYFEATFQYNPSQVIHKNGWPAWWGEPEEHFKSGSNTNSSQYWNFYDTANPSDPGSVHFEESDFFECNIQSGYYAGSMIDWFGTYGPKGYSNIQSPWADKQLKYPANIDYSVPHKYGFLWIPATTTTNGSATFCFDGVPYSKQAITWQQYQGQAPYAPTGAIPPFTATPWTFSILDQQHLALIVNTGLNEPMLLTAVNVWQANSNWDIHTGTLYDTLNNLSSVSSEKNMQIVEPDKQLPASDFNGDNSVAARATPGPGTLVYKLPNIRSFTARVFAYGDTTPLAVDFAVSKTGLPGSYVRIPAVSATSKEASTDGAFGYEDLSNSDEISPGYDYLQIVLPANPKYHLNLAIGQVRIN